MVGVKFTDTIVDWAPLNEPDPDPTLPTGTGKDRPRLE